MVHRARVLSLCVLVILFGACGPGSLPAPVKPPPGSVRLWQDATIFGEIRGLIDGAGARIWVEMYEFDRSDLVSALIAQRERGIDVRVITDPTVDVSVATAKRLRAAGLDVRFYPVDDRRYQIDHVKLLLADGVAMMGGMNWGSTSDRNHDYDLEVTSPPEVARFASIFAQDWDLAGGSPRPLAAVSGDVAQTSPGDEIRSLLEGAALGATRRIYVEIFTLTDIQMEDLLIGARRRGVEVRVLLDPWQSLNRAAYDLLVKGGVGARWYPIPKDAKLHAKVGLFDTEVVVGSANWTVSGLGVNHELDMSTADPLVVAAYAKRFEEDWAVGY